MKGSDLAGDASRSHYANSEVSVDGQSSILARPRSGAERRWVEGAQAQSTSDYLARCRYSDCAGDSCWNVFPVGQPAMKRR
jgi:hypothetical protein